MIYLFEKDLLVLILNFIHIKIDKTWYFNLQTLRTFVQLKVISILYNSLVEGRYLVAGFENFWFSESRSERVGSQKLKGNDQIGFPLRNFLFLIFMTPQCTIGTKKAQKAHKGTPSKKVFFQKTWWKRVKEYSFNLGTERGIVEDYVTVILPPQLTL